MTEVQILHAQFKYYTEGKAVDPKTGETKPRLVPHVALRNQIVDIPRDEDVARGEDAHAFYTEEDYASDEETSADEVTAETAPTENDHDALVVWIRDERPNAATVVAAAGDDPERAQALIDAENEASGGDPRKSVIDPLSKIAAG